MTLRMILSLVYFGILLQEIAFGVDVHGRENVSFKERKKRGG
jgi:hypothetical protein